MKRLMSLFLITAFFVIPLSGCGGTDAPAEPPSSAVSTAASAVESGVEAPVSIQPVFLKKSEIATLPPEYVPLSKAVDFDKSIITADLLSKSSKLPEATNQKLPYWTGAVCDARAWVNMVPYYDVYKPISDGSQIIYEDYIKQLADDGFNCFRMLYSLSFLDDPQNAENINLSELKYLDEIISWGLKHDVHIMISITGLPGKYDPSLSESQRSVWPNEGQVEENVQMTEELFTNSATAKRYGDCMALLAKRYAAIPNNNLSFELLAEPRVPDENCDAQYTGLLGPVVKAMWAYNPARVLIANDMAKQFPKGMAALGCAVSLHNHIYTVNGDQVQGAFGISHMPTWPMEYLPSEFLPDSGDLKLVFESPLKDASLTVTYAYIEPFNMQLLADGTVIAPTTAENNRVIYKDIPDGTAELLLRPTANGFLVAIELTQSEAKPLSLVTHNLYGNGSFEPMPTIKVKADGTTENLSGQVLDADYIYDALIKPFADQAASYGVGFSMTEIGTDTTQLPLEQYFAYNSQWLTALKERDISWMYNCQENYLAPKGRLYPPLIVAQSVLEPYGETHFLINRTLVDFLKKYQ